MPSATHFILKKLSDLDSFINSQLNDTRYISREVLHYVKQLYSNEHATTAVSISKGGFTAWLRHTWGLNSIMNADDQKDRSDHRHHLIDAAITASTDRSLYQKISLQAKQHDNDQSIKIKHCTTMEKFKNDLSHLLDSVIISHAPRRRIADALHEQTAYGVQHHPEKTGQRVVYRKLLNGDLSEKQVQKVVDPSLREKLLAHLAAHDNTPKLLLLKTNLSFFILDRGVFVMCVLLHQKASIPTPISPSKTLMGKLINITRLATTTTLKY